LLFLSIISRPYSVIKGNSREEEKQKGKHLKKKQRCNRKDLSAWYLRFRPHFYTGIHIEIQYY